MPNVAILMASAAQSNLHQERYSETLVIKSHVLSLVNRFIQEDFFLVGNQSLRIVIHLVVLEVWRANPAYGQGITANHGIAVVLLGLC